MSRKQSADQQKLKTKAQVNRNKLYSNAFPVKTSQSAKNWLDLAGNENQPKK